MKRISIRKLEGAIREYSRQNDGIRVYLYKGHTMNGEYGWIARKFGHNEWYLGKNIASAYDTVMDWLGFREEATC